MDWSLIPRFSKESGVLRFGSTPMKRIALIAILFLLIMMPSVSASEGPVNPPPAGLWQPAFGSTPSTGNYVYLKSDYGDYIGAGQTYSYTLANAQISVSATGGYLSVSIVGDQNWTGNFQAMSGISQLQLGYYGNLQRYSFHNPVLGGLDWSGEGRGSNTLTGWFAIDNITYANGILTAIDLRFEQHSEGGSPALHGQIHWRLDDTAIAIAILQGDIDNSGIVDLQDAIIALQIFSGMNVVIPVYPSADVNGYGQIGIAEAIYALQCLARLRNNHAPVLTAIGNQTVDEGALLTFTISATDMDGDTITYSVSTPPSGATLNSSNGTFSWTPTYAQSGTYQVTFNVRDDYGGKASETITITVNDKPPVYTAAEYYPINVGDWHDYADTTGNTYHSTVTGTRLIGSMLTMVEADWTGTQSYITSDQNGIKIYGQYDPAYKVEIIFGTPLLMVPPIPQLGTPQVSMSYYSMIYSGQLFHVNVTSTVNIIGIEDVQTENMVLKDCIKISSRLDQFLVERGQYVSGDTSYQWFYKGVGMVKQVSGSDTYVISASFVNGVAQNY